MNRPILEVTAEECRVLAHRLFRSEGPAELAEARLILEWFRKGAHPLEVVQTVRSSRAKLGVSKWPFNSSKPVPQQESLPLGGPLGTNEKTEPWRAM